MDHCRDELVEGKDVEVVEGKCFSSPAAERCVGGASGKQCQWSWRAEIPRFKRSWREMLAQSLEPMVNPAHLEEEHEGGVEGGEGGEETHGGTPE